MNSLLSSRVSVWRRTLAVLVILPAAVCLLTFLPARAATPPAPVPRSAVLSEITATGTYDSANPDCHSGATTDGCLTWEVFIPQSVGAESGPVTATVEADSRPGEWTWSCEADNDVRGTSTFFTPDRYGGPDVVFARSGLGFFNRLYYHLYGEYIAEVLHVECTPEHLSLTMSVDFSYRSAASYLHMAIGAAVSAPGPEARTYTADFEVLTSTSSTSTALTATATKRAAEDTQVSVTSTRTSVPGAGEDVGRFTVEVRNDSTRALTDFTVDSAVTAGPARITALTCDLSAYGGQVVTDTDASDGLSISSGDASVPGRTAITCLIDLSGIVGRNTVTTAVTADGESFVGHGFAHRPIVEVEVEATDASINVETFPVGEDRVPDHAFVRYTVTFTNITNADGRSSPILLHAEEPAGFTFLGAWGDWSRFEGTHQGFSDFIGVDADGFLRADTATALTGEATQVITFGAVYRVDVHAVTAADGWDRLATCVPGDPATGLTTTIEVAAAPGLAPTVLTTCTAVNRPANL